MFDLKAIAHARYCDGNNCLYDQYPSLFRGHVCYGGMIPTWLAKNIMRKHTPDRRNKPRTTFRHNHETRVPKKQNTVNWWKGSYEQAIREDKTRDFRKWEKGGWTGIDKRDYMRPRFEDDEKRHIDEQLEHMWIYPLDDTDMFDGWMWDWEHEDAMGRWEPDPWDVSRVHEEAITQVEYDRFMEIDSLMREPAAVSM